MYAAQQGSTDIVRILLEHGADVNTKSSRGELHAIILTISIHPSIYLYTFICVYNFYTWTLNNKIYFKSNISGMTSLMSAAINYEGNTDTVRILLEHGADINAKDEDGELHTISQHLFIHLSVYIYHCVYKSYKCTVNNKICIINSI